MEDMCPHAKRRTVYNVIKCERRLPQSICGTEPHLWVIDRQITRLFFFFLFPTLNPLSGVGTTCFHHVVIKIRHLFLQPATCLTSTLLETGVGANDCKCSRDQQITCLPKHGGARDNKF
jgi:hypothetical protein